MLQWLTSEDEYVSCLLKVPSKRANWKNLQKNGKEGIRTRQGFGELKSSKNPQMRG